jgi:hypothetical protein
LGSLEVGRISLAIGAGAKSRLVTGS